MSHDKEHSKSIPATKRLPWSLREAALLIDERAPTLVPMVLNDYLETPERSDLAPERGHCSPTPPAPPRWIMMDATRDAPERAVIVWSISYKHRSSDTDASPHKLSSLGSDAKDGNFLSSCVSTSTQYSL